MSKSAKWCPTVVPKMRRPQQLSFGSVVKGKTKGVEAIQVALGRKWVAVGR
jgi:hypothetical protein